MKRAAIGLRAHSGWTAMVAVAGTIDAPEILDGTSFPSLRPFRDARRRACSKWKIPIATLVERDAFDAAARIFKLKPVVLKRCCDAMGKPLSPPWRQDEKLSALGASTSLAG